MRAVFDTNVIIAAFLWQQELKPIYDAIRARRVTPCMSQALWSELHRVLSYPKFIRQLQHMDITPAEITQLLADRAFFVLPRIEVEEIKEDPSDNEILACAVVADAVCMVSGDNHLLQLHRFRGIPIITPREFMNSLERVY